MMDHCKDESRGFCQVIGDWKAGLDTYRGMRWWSGLRLVMNSEK